MKHKTDVKPDTQHEPSAPSDDPTKHPYQAYLFGEPIAHSLSPLLHNTIYSATQTPWNYAPHESRSISSFLDLLKRPDCIGSSVTMPHKIAIIPHLDELTPEGREVGAVNTVFTRTVDGQRRFIGTNTDVVGVREAFTQNVKDIHRFDGRAGLVIGGGGAARSAIYALSKWFDCSAIYIVNRDAAEVKATVDSCTAAGFGRKLIHITGTKLAMTMATPALVVSCVPDLSPETPEEISARASVIEFLDRRDKGVVLEMAYHPRVNTAFARLAVERGWQVIFGTEAMIWQGVEQEMLWMGKEVPGWVVDEVKRVVGKALKERERES